MNNNSDNTEDKPIRIPVENPIPCGCPHCWNSITSAHMEGEYIVYKCTQCEWETPRDTFYQIGKPKKEWDEWDEEIHTW